MELGASKNVRRKKGNKEHTPFEMYTNYVHKAVN